MVAAWLDLNHKCCIRQEHYNNTASGEILNGTTVHREHSFGSVELEVYVSIRAGNGAGLETYL